MKHLLSFLFALICFNLSAQSKWSVGVVGGVDFSVTTNSFFGSVGFGELNAGSAEPISYAQNGIFSSRYGVKVGYEINEKLTLQSGAVFNAQGGSFGSSIIWPSERDDMGRFVDDPSLSNYQKIRESHQYLEIPLHLRICFPEKEYKWKWHIEGGVSPNVYLRSTTKGIVEGFGVIEEYKRQEPMFRSVSASFDFGFGTSLEIGERSSIFVQPMIRYFFVSVLEKIENDFKANYFNVGIELGCSYALN